MGPRASSTSSSTGRAATLSLQLVCKAFALQGSPQAWFAVCCNCQQLVCQMQHVFLMYALENCLGSVPHIPLAKRTRPVSEEVRACSTTNSPVPYEKKYTGSVNAIDDGGQLRENHPRARDVFVTHDRAHGNTHGHAWKMSCRRQARPSSPPQGCCTRRQLVTFNVARELSSCFTNLTSVLGL